MTPLLIRDMLEADESFVSACTHVGESSEIDRAAGRRLAWLRGKHHDGLRVKVAVIEGRANGFLYLMPIEICPWGPSGRDLMAIPCLFVKTDAQRQGAGRALVASAEDEARHQGRRGIVTLGYYHDFWFMPARFFEGLGFKAAERRGEQAVLWKAFDDSVAAPRLLRSAYKFEAVPGKVVVDLFFNSFCLTSNIETQRVREVAAEFGNRVVLQEHPAGDQQVPGCFQTPRGIFVDGEEIGWGYEAPKEGIREAMIRALETAERA